MAADYFLILRGQKRLIQFSPSTAQGTTDISGWTLVFSIATQPGKTPLFTDAPTLTSAPAGTFSVSLSAAETASLSVGRYYWDVWRTDSGFEDRIASGNLQVSNGVHLPA